MKLEERAALTPTSPAFNSTIAARLDIFILLVIFLFSLFNLPHALTYLANNRFDALQGYFLRYSTHLRRHRPRLGTTLQSKHIEKLKEPPQFGIHRSHSATTLQCKEKEKLEGPLEDSLPTPTTSDPAKRWHIPMHLSLRSPIASFVHYRTLGDYTVLQILLMAGYTAAVFYAAFYKSNPFTSPLRAGWIAACQIPFVYAFATKNNIIGLLVGVGYEKLNFLHRHVGRLMVIGANVHAIGFIYKWSLNGTMSKNLAAPYVRYGLLALGCFDILGFFSIQYVRNTSYNLFLATHITGLVVALVALCFHEPACIPYVIAGSAVYGLDHIIRAVKTRFTIASLQTIPELGLTRIDIPSLNTGWRAGQHVRLRVLSTAMGLWGMAEVHPFTISSASNTEEGLVLMCKRNGRWTEDLYQMAQASETGELAHGDRGRVRVMVEGPYGGVGDTTIHNYSGAMFVAGGSGLTFALSGLQDLVLAGDRSRTKVVEIIWIIKNPAALKHFIPLFTVLISQFNPVRVRVYYTRTPTHSFEGFELPDGVTLTPGRPDMRELVDGLVASMTSEGGTHGAFVGVCGPTGLGEDVARAVRICNADSKKAVGGIQLHEEAFGW